MKRTGDRVTIPMIAEATGYSMMTVSNALNGRHPVSAEALDIITKTANELGYYPDTAARGLRNKESGIIALVGKDQLPDLTPWVAQLQRRGYLPLTLLDDGAKTRGRLVGSRAQACIYFGRRTPSAFPVKTVLAGKDAAATVDALDASLRGRE